MTISFLSLKKSVVNIINSSTNKAFLVLVDPSRLQLPFNRFSELFAPYHILLSLELRIHTWIEPLDLEFFDSVGQCFQNPCQRAVTELVYLVKPHNLSFIIVEWEHDCSRRLNDGIIMLKLVACSTPSWFSKVQLCLNQKDDRDDLVEGADSGLQSHWDAGLGVAGLSSTGSGFHQPFLESAVGDNSRVLERPADLYLMSDVVQAINCGAEAADLDELGALLPLPRAPDAPAGGCGGGGYGGGDLEGVLGGGGIVIVVMTVEVVADDVGSGEPDYDIVRSITGVVIGGTEEVS
nr:hypothetical protein [Tanacetum cinerariifolium]